MPRAPVRYTTYIVYTVALKIFDECEMDSGEYENLDRPFNKIKQSLKFKFRKTVSEKYTSRTLQKLSNMNNDSKLFLYSQLKTQIKLEEYLLKETSFKNRQLLTKFRISDHSLKIEIGRYRNIPKEQRLCDNCKVIDNDHHFFLHCN